ncbi:MAG TPA: DHA2 family efflux MFS transporter permease subunit [Caulobacteraceae bacterium]|jgi:DHA2 family multidrug resistance protein|nr:DHA2 family efflux MFS transporter permease subunit [Caulobacteraceae bacterium]
MSEAGTAGAQAGGWTPERSAAGNRSPWLVVFVISIATFMEVLDSAIANVSLNHIAGSLSASYDEATWVLTSYLISNAIIIPISGWLSDVIGRKRYYMISVALFAGSSLLCGLAPSLSILIMARVLQGIGGGGLAPSEQAMLADTFPPQKRGLAFAAYGIVVIVGPILGPTLGGWITDNLSWHWIFLINVPIGCLSLFLVNIFVDEPEAVQRDREEKLRGGLKVDYIGFALIAVGLGFLEFTLDRGQRDDWFTNPVILASAVASGLCILTLIPWELTHKDPIINLRLFGRRNFAVTCLVMLTVGMILFGTTQFIPQLLQQVLGYTATDAGMALTAGGLATVLVMPFAGILSSKVDARILLGVALVIQATALWHMTHLSADMSFKDAALARMWQAVGLPFLFVPITAVAYVGLAPGQNNQASALMNVTRNLGGSFGISLTQTLIAQRQQFHQARLVEQLNRFNPYYNSTIKGSAANFAHHGAGALQATQQANASLLQNVMNQASMLSFIDAFRVLMIVVFCVTPVIFLMRANHPGKAPAGAH